MWDTEENKTSKIRHDLFLSNVYNLLGEQETVVRKGRILINPALVGWE